MISSGGGNGQGGDGAVLLDRQYVWPGDLTEMASLKHWGFDQAFNDPSSFFSAFFVTTGDATWIAFWVLVIGIVIGVIGASIGLRRFLRT